MRKLNLYSPVFWAVSLIASTTSANAGEIPENWKPYQTKALVMKPGYKFYQQDGQGYIFLNTPVGEKKFKLDITLPETETQIQEDGTTSACFEEIQTVEQARELCELLLQVGAIVEDAESYKKLLKVHRDFGLEQLVEDKELVFEPVAKAVERGFQIAFTVFYDPRYMGAQSVVARVEFFVAKDATFKIKSRTYLRSMYLNWQTGMLDTTEKQAEEGKKLRRVEKFLEEIYKICSTLRQRQE